MAKILNIIVQAPHVSQRKIGHTTYTTGSGKQPDFKMISKQLWKKADLEMKNQNRKKNRKKTQK